MNDDPIKVGVANKEGQLGFLFTKGGVREGAGRKNIGVTKKISLTLTEETWEKIEKRCSDYNQSRSEALRNMIENFLSN